MKRIIIKKVILFAFVGSLHVSAQKSSHEFSVYSGGGLSTLGYKAPSIERNTGGGVNFGVGYVFFRGKDRSSETGTVLRETWGIHTGVGISTYNANARIIEGEIITRNLIDNELHSFDMYSKLSGYSENQKVTLLNIPLMAEFQLSRFYLLSGVKVGIPVGSRFRSSCATLFNKGYYLDFENWTEEQNFAGFGTFSGVSTSGNIDFGICVMMSLEAGRKWRIADKLTLYAGAYFDYGLNNAIKNSKNAFISYNYSNNLISTNSILTEKINVMAAGIKLRLAFSL